MPTTHSHDTGSSRNQENSKQNRLAYTHDSLPEEDDLRPADVGTAHALEIVMSHPSAPSALNHGETQQTAAIIQLQRSIGNLATGRLLQRQRMKHHALAEPIPHSSVPSTDHTNRVRRYITVNTGGYTTYKGSKEEVFAMQSAAPTFDKSGANAPAVPVQPLDANEKKLSSSQQKLKQAKYKQQASDLTNLIRQVDLPQYRIDTPGAPTLLVSDDGTMAVPSAVAQQSKVLFAVQAVIDDANNRLQAAGSQVRLQKVGNSVGLTVNHQYRILHQVKPYAAALGPTARGALADFGTSICVDMATNVVGGLPSNQVHMVFKPTTGAEKERSYIGDKRPDSMQNVPKLADALTDPGFDPTQNIGTQIAAHNPRAKTGEDYGTALQANQLDATAQQLGINQYAAPEVGEGFGISSIKTAVDDTANTDFSTGQVNTDSWGYHFAGVVAKSQTGSDYAVLENYNRADELLRGWLKDMIQKRATQLDPTTYQELLESAQSAGRTTAVMEVVERAFGLKNSDELAVQLNLHFNRLTEEGKVWFFAMYGSNPGQTFHEMQAASGAFVNPLTVRVGAAAAPAVPGLAPQPGALNALSVTSQDVSHEGGTGAGGLVRDKSTWKLIYKGLQALENQGFTQQRFESLYTNIIKWQTKNEARTDRGDRKKRTLLDRLRPEVENFIEQYKSGARH